MVLFLDKYLDAAARKYVQVFRCECFYISPYDELKKIWEEAAGEEEGEERGEEAGEEGWCFCGF